MGYNIQKPWLNPMRLSYDCRAFQKRHSDMSHQEKSGALNNNLKDDGILLS